MGSGHHQDPWIRRHSIMMLKPTDMSARRYSKSRILLLLAVLFNNVCSGESLSCSFLHKRTALAVPTKRSQRYTATGILKQDRSSLRVSTGDEDFASSKRRLDKCRSFLSKNFFLCGMFVAIGLAKALPHLGKNGGMLRPELFIGKYGVTLVFLLSGLSLELKQLTSAVANWKLNLLVNGLIFGAWPYFVGLPLAKILPASLKDGMLIMTSLPTTVNMCVILTAAAGGNVAAALCNAVFSNLIGIFATPALLYRLMGSTAIALPFREMLFKLSNKVLVPVAVGQLLRQTPLRKISKAKALKRIQEIILLSILWNAFCTSFSAATIGVELKHVLLLLGILPVLHLSVVGVLFGIISRLGFSRGDVVASVLCASQKTLAFGLPLIHTLFSSSSANKLAAYSAPIMFMHPIQLIVGSLLLPFLQRYTSDEEKTA